MQRLTEHPSQGEVFNKTIKSGGANHKLVYVRWPQEALFIDPDRQGVKYDDLFQFQWTAGLSTIAAEERDPVIQRNMLINIIVALVRMSVTTASKTFPLYKSTERTTLTDPMPLSTLSEQG